MSDALIAFLDQLDAAGAERIVVRWIDETRPVADQHTGMTVGPVKQATVTARQGNEALQRTFTGIGYDQLRRLIAGYPFEAIYRSDNVT